MADVVKVRNAHGETRTFDSRVWAKMTNKYGWSPISDAPQEVKDMKQAGAGKGSSNRSAKASTAKVTKNTVDKVAPLQPAPTTTRGGAPRVQEVMNAINAATSVGDIDKITAGDNRPSIQKAAASRKDQLK